MARVLVSNTLIKVHVNQVNIRFCEIYLNARPNLANLTIALRSTVGAQTIGHGEDLPGHGGQFL